MLQLRHLDEALDGRIFRFWKAVTELRFLLLKGFCLHSCLDFNAG